MFLSTIPCTARSDYEVHQHLHHFFRDEERRYLWRRCDETRVYVLSVVPPVETVQARRIAPHQIPSGKPLSFSVRLVAARSRTREGHKHSAKVPIRCMHERRRWLTDKLAAAGADLKFARFEDVVVNGKGGLKIVGAEVTGVLVIQDRARFLTRMQLGFGRNLAFGCGLMWIPEVFDDAH